MYNNKFINNKYIKMFHSLTKFSREKSFKLLFFGINFFNYDIN